MKSENIHLFWGHVEKRGDSECWPWKATLDKDGYGQLVLDRKTRQAHRVSYTLAVGAIPPGLQIDHLCRNRACVNPSHLEAVTGRVNTLRGVGFSARNAAKPTCDYGHNEWKLRRGRRVCMECDRRRQREMKARRREVTP